MSGRGNLEEIRKLRKERESLMKQKDESQKKVNEWKNEGSEGVKKAKDEHFKDTRRLAKEVCNSSASFGEGHLALVKKKRKSVEDLRAEMKKDGVKDKDLKIKNAEKNIEEVVKTEREIKMNKEDEKYLKSQSQQQLQTQTGVSRRR